MNNPFAKPPQTELSSAAQRFPDVLHTDPDLQQTQGQYGYAQGQGQVFAQQTGYGGGGMNGYAGQGQPQGGMGYGAQQQQGGYLQPQQTGYGGGGGYAGQSPMGGPGGIYSPGPGVQQQQYGYQQQQQPQYTGMQSYQPSYSSAPPPPVSDLDPYSSLSSSSFASPSPAPSSQQQAGSLLAVPQMQSHPRDYVQENRAQLMSWDEYAWRQLDNRIDALREAWQTRLALLRAASEQGADPIKTEQLRKEGEGFVDSIHAAKMQLGEVKAGWRHSTDAASKSRVREALNAGLSSLPPYPTPLPPQALGGSFALSATKQHILSQYGQPQQQQVQGQMTGMGYYAGGAGGYGGGGGMMPQQTGYGGMGGGMGMVPQQTGYGGGNGGYGAGGAGGGGGYY
ncbi:hypothetical protein RTBOTA2_005298 [Rhodotorula toruloides]|uniref:Uncharacterized protein n=1 Tax=Rhodotorula toruloides TaxID=5286 RepID=A0A2T0A7X6_RHOTO|nr:hypothetical protein RTBOTA2_005298 [Rhodotorula toruloides]PRQ74132.1 hypothetical protein AAT19DRAFT_14485 [Rhodotorula toruloides]